MRPTPSSDASDAPAGSTLTTKGNGTKTGVGPELKVGRSTALSPWVAILRATILFAILLGTGGCGYNSRSARPQRVLRVTAQLTTETGRPMVSTPLEIVVQGFYGATPKATDATARWSAELKRLNSGTGWVIDPLLDPAPLPRRMPIAIRLPSFESEAVYPVEIRPRDGDSLGDQPYAVLASIKPSPSAVRDGQTIEFRHADAYCPVDGALRWATLAKEGVERVVPPVWDDLKLSHPRHPAGEREPGAPRLAITARIVNLAKDRDQLSLEIRVIYYDHE